MHVYLTQFGLHSPRVYRTKSGAYRHMKDKLGWQPDELRKLVVWYKSGRDYVSSYSSVRKLKLED